MANRRKENPVLEFGVGLYCMKCTCIIHDTIDLRQFTLRSTAHRMQRPSSFQIWVGLKITYWFLMGDNGYGPNEPLSATSFGLPAKDIWNAEDIQKHSAQRDRHPGVNWQTYNVLILHWTFICLAVGYYWERPAWTPWSRLKGKTSKYATHGAKTYISVLLYYR